MLSFIVPIYYKKKNYIYNRAEALIQKFKRYPEIELIIVDTSPYSKLSNIKNKNIKILKHPLQEKIFSPAKARNMGVKLSSKEYILFFDVDLDFHEIFLDLLIKEIDQKLSINTKSFLMIPCLYLTKEGTLYYNERMDKLNTVRTMRESFLLGENKYVERTAINTSLVITRKAHFLEIGQFDENFSGHGGEDFELLHRLASFFPHSKRSNSDEYYTDIVAQFIIDYQGFRQYLAYYSLEYLFTDLLIIHRWHKRPLFNSFYWKRVKNEELLYKKMKNHDKNKKLQKMIWNSNNQLTEYTIYIKNILDLHNYYDDKYCGLYKFKNNVKMKRPLGAKVRKLITRPKQFFKDIEK